MWPFKTILYFLMFWVACLASLVNPIWGVTNYMMAYQMNPPVTWWGQPLLATGMRFSMLAAAFTILGMFFSRHRVPLIKPVFSLWELGVFALLGIGVLNTLFGIGYGAGAQHAFEKFWKLQVFVFILARLATTRRNLHLVIWTIVLGSLYLGYDAFTASPDAFSKGRLDIFGGPDIATSSGAAAHLTAMLPLIGVAFLIAKSWRWRLLAVVSGGLTINAIILCRTRSAFVGLICGAFAALVMVPRHRRFRIRLLLVVGGILAFSLTDAHYWERIGTLADQQALQKDSAAQARTEIRQASYRIVADYPLGVGLGNFPRIIGRYVPLYAQRAPHSTLVMCFTELGVLGGIVFLLIVLESLRLVFQCSKFAARSDQPAETKIMAYGLLVALVTYFVAGLGTDRFTCESYWWILLLPLCLDRVIAQEFRAHVEVREPRVVPDLVEAYSFGGKLRYGF